MIYSCFEGLEMNCTLDFLLFLTVLYAGRTLHSFQLEYFILIVQFKRRKALPKYLILRNNASKNEKSH